MGELVKITADRAREVLCYDPESGHMFWRQTLSVRAPAGTRAGNTYLGHRTRYCRVRVDGQSYELHRLAWLMMTGNWPDAEIDHIDGDGSNNRWANLRAATSRENKQNLPRRVDNRSGVNGVSWDSGKRKWAARIREPGGKYLFLGRFDDLQEAAAARKAADVKYGYHPNHGRVSHG